MMSILATIDGSPESLAVIPALESLAPNMRLHVRLLMIAERPKATPRRSSLGRAPFSGVPATPGGVMIPSNTRTRGPRWSESDDQAVQRALAEGRDFLESAAKRLREGGIQTDVEVLIDGHIAKAIINYARREKFDLIAMATHGRGSLSDLVQGSIASAVVRSGIAPVLLTRPSKAQVRAYRSIARTNRGGGLQPPAT
jgi:nucleotide-binding universal stress UspA family protein